MVFALGYGTMFEKKNEIRFMYGQWCKEVKEESSNFHELTNFKRIQYRNARRTGPSWELNCSSSGTTLLLKRCTIRGTVRPEGYLREYWR